MAPDVGPRKVPGLRNLKPAVEPAREVAGVARHDRVVGQHAAERGDRPTRMDTRPVPRAVVDDRGRLPGCTVGLVPGMPFVD